MKAKKISSRSTETIGLKPENIPTNEKRILVKSLLEVVSAAFEDPEVKKDYERWKADRVARAAT